MKKIAVFAITVVALFAAVNVNAHGSNSWHNMAQWQRNQKIIQEGLKDKGKVTDTCKRWVQLTVVKNASNGHVFLPPNNSSPNDWYWGYDSNSHAIGMSIPIQYAQPGWIVQMRLKYKDKYGRIKVNPHTAIIKSKNSSGVTFLHSNWVSKNKVSEDPIPYSKFKAYADGGMLAFTGSYTVYYIQ